MPWTHVINDVNGKNIMGTFYKKRVAKKSKRV